MKKGLLLITAIMSAAIIGNVNAASRYSGANITYEYDFGDIEVNHINNGHTKQYIQISGEELKTTPEGGESTYYLCWTRKNEFAPFKESATSGVYTIDLPPVQSDNNNIDHSACFIVNKAEGGDEFAPINAVAHARWIFEEDYNYFYFIQKIHNTDDSEYTERYYVSEPITAVIDDFEQGKKYEFMIKGKGYDGSSDTYSSAFSIVPYYNTGLTRNIKIVKIEDMSIIKNYANKKSGAYTDLVNYIKNNTGFSAQNKFSDFKFDASTLQLEANAFYGVYFSYDTTGRLDYTDAVITRADSKGIYLAEFDDFGEFLDTKTEVKGDNVKNPKTGLAKYYWIAPVVVLLVGSLFVIIKKNKLFKSI